MKSLYVGLLCACGRLSGSAPQMDASPVGATSSVATATVAPANGQEFGSAPVASVGASASASATVDVVSSASTAYAWGKVVTGGAVDGPALRKQNRARIAADTSPVRIEKGGTAAELGERVCAAKLPTVPPETPVLIKPNMGGFDWFKTGGTDDGVRGRITDPEFVAGIIHCLKAKGLRKITVAEGWGAKHEDWERLIRVSGYEAMTKREGVALVAMDDDGVFDVEGSQPGKPMEIRGIASTHVPTLLMPKILAEHLEKGLFISAPKIKAHRFAVFSMAIKGMQGTVMMSDKAPAFRQKWRMHRELSLEDAKKGTPESRKTYVAALEAFAERMTDVLELEAPHVVFAEGAPAMSGDGFQKLIPSEASFALGGTNPILVDRVGAALMGLYDNEALGKELLGHTTSPLLTTAAKRFGVALANPRVEGTGADLFSKTYAAHYHSLAGFDIEGAGNATPSAAKPELRAEYVADGQIRVDGRADEVAWAKTQAVRFDTDYRGEPAVQGGKPVTTEVRALWSERGLILHWTSSNTGLFVDTAKPVEVEREGLYKEDCVELFLSPDPKAPRSYAEIEVGPLGHFFDLWVDKGKGDTKWSGGLTVGARHSKDEAEVEVQITAKEITAALHPGARLPLGLYRMEGKAPRHYLAWSPPKTTKPNFHVPEAFGVLVLAPQAK